MLCSREVCYQERTYCKEECYRDVTCQVTATRWEWYDTHEVRDEYEEETGQQIRRIPIRFLTYTAKLP